MNPKIAFVTINGVFFITNGHGTDATRNIYYHKKKYQLFICWFFGKQLASYLTLTKSCFSYGVYFVEALPLFLE